MYLLGLRQALGILAAPMGRRKVDFFCSSPPQIRRLSRIPLLPSWLKEARRIRLIFMGLHRPPARRLLRLVAVSFNVRFWEYPRKPVSLRARLADEIPVRQPAWKCRACADSGEIAGRPRTIAYEISIL
jgi:hypothetical protein